MPKKKHKQAKPNRWKEPSSNFNNPFAHLLGDGTPPAEPSTVDSTPQDVIQDVIPTMAIVHREKKRRRGKQVTIITHLELSTEGLKRWCSAMRTDLGCGGTVELDAVVLQGDQRDRCAAWLEKKGVKRVVKTKG